MGRLDAVLGRSPLDWPEEAPDEVQAPELWLDRTRGLVAFRA
jgi:hypothetical protein